jgi:hypothetical protein
MNDENLNNISNKVEIILWKMKNFGSSISSVITVVLTIFLVTTISKLKLPIDQSNYWHLTGSIILLWGCIWLINAILILPIWLLSKRSHFLADQSAWIYRVLLLTSTIISIFLHSNLLIEIMGIIGAIVSLGVFVYLDHWYIFPAEALYEFNNYQNLNVVLPGGSNRNDIPIP